MGKTHIEQVESGMRLGSDVRHRTGRLLLARGTVLEESHLMVLRTWGIREIDIAGISPQGKTSEPPLPVEISPAQLQKAKEQMRPAFSLAGTKHPVMRELLRLAALRKAQYG